MKLFKAFVRKEFYHIFRDKRTMLILLIMPVVQIILFGFAISVEWQNMRVGIVMPDDITSKEQVQQIADKINANEVCKVTAWYSSAQEVEKAMQRNELDAALFFSPSNPGNAVQIIVDAVNPTLSSSAAYYLKAILTDFYTKNQERSKHLGSRGTLQPVVHMLYNPQMISAYNFVPGVLGLIFILICALMTSISIVKEKETGSMEVLLVSPARPIYMIFAKMVPYFVLSCVNLATILMLSFYVLHVPMTGAILSMCAVSLLYIFLSLSLGLLISTLVKQQVSAMMISIVGLMVPVTMLSGMIFSIENMPWILQQFSSIVPARWYISAMRKLMIQGVSITQVLPEICILIGMSFLILTLALKKFSNRL